MLRLLLGKDWKVLRRKILSEVSGNVAARQEGTVLIVPELISHEMERALCAAAGDTASRYAEVLSFSRLCRAVAEEVGCAGMQCLDNGGRVVAMAAAARQLSSRLKAYAALESKPEFLKELVDAVDEFKRCCITPEELKTAAARTTGSLAQKLEELGLLMESYDSLCAQGRRDPRDQMTWLLERLEDSQLELTIPVGSLLPLEPTWARGPELHLRALALGTASAEFESEFTSAGINQTKHRIVLRIDVYVSILLPGYSTVTQVTNEITVAETVIVGEVPGTYTYFATDPDAYAGDAKDYILNKD